MNHTKSSTEFEKKSKYVREKDEKWNKTATLLTHYKNGGDRSVTVYFRRVTIKCVPSVLNLDEICVHLNISHTKWEGT